MRQDITRWTRGCIVCATRNVGRAVKPPMTPIPVAGPFDRIGVDIIQFPKTSRGNQYAVVFVDYLTKWPEVFAVPDQSAATVARLLVEEIVSRHGVPSEVLSDRGRAFLSGLMREVELLLGFRKTNTTAYHPQTDGLVERYNRTLTAMLAKTVEKRDTEWDTRLPYVLFAYRACQQSSTQESPFFLLYGRDPRLPTPGVLSPKMTRTTVCLKEYGVELHAKMSDAWELARLHITRAQKRQKTAYDKCTKRSPFRTGERVFLYKPAEQTGQKRKFAGPFHGPYRLGEVGANTAKIRPVGTPESEPILVALNRLRRCPDEISDEFWPPTSKKCPRKKKAAEPLEPADGTEDHMGEVDKLTELEWITESGVNPEAAMDCRPVLTAGGDGFSSTAAASNGDSVGATQVPDEDANIVEYTTLLTEEDSWDRCPLLTAGGSTCNSPRGDTQPATMEDDDARSGSRATDGSGAATQPPDGAQNILGGDVAEGVKRTENGKSARGIPTKLLKKDWGSVRRQEQDPKQRENLNHTPSRWAGRLRQSTRRTLRMATCQQGEI